MKSHLRCFAIFIVLIAGAGCGRSGSQASAIAPDFRLNDLTGLTVFLNAQLHRPVILTFFATWCTPCRDEIPTLVDLHKRYQNRIQVLCIDVDPENIDTIHSIAAALKIPYPILLDEGRRTMERYGVQKLPTTFLIDTKGRIMSRYGAIGEAEIRSLSEQIERLVNVAHGK